MTAELYANDNGTARKAREIWVNDNGTARRIQEIWINDNGTARKIYAGDVISIGFTNSVAVTSSPVNAAAQFLLTNTGDIQSTVNGGQNALFDVGDWITPKSNMSAYECRATLQLGSLSSGTTGAWQSLSTTRSWSKVAVPGTGIQQAAFLLEIRRASDSVVVASTQISLSAESTV